MGNRASVHFVNRIDDTSVVVFHHWFKSAIFRADLKTAARRARLDYLPASYIATSFERDIREHEANERRHGWTRGHVARTTVRVGGPDQLQSDMDNPLIIITINPDESVNVTQGEHIERYRWNHATNDLEELV